MKKSTTYPISQTNLKHYLLHHSLLSQPNLSLNQVLTHYSCIQVDPIDVVATTHELALFNRVENFTRRDLQQALYQDRILFEYWLQLYSIIPTEFYSHLSARRSIREPWHKQFAQNHAQELNLTRLYIQSHGPTSSFELTHIERKSKALFSWSNTKTNTGLLEYLWDVGELSVHHRVNNRKYYDFTWRLYPTNQTQSISSLASKEWLLESFFRYFGILRRSQLRRVGYSRTLALDKLFDKWVNQGRVVRLEIPSVGTKYYVLQSQISQLEQSVTSENPQTINILPPLDPLILDRQALHDIFQFDYTWEAYVPAAKRKFGYYGMPVLYRGEFVGQIELAKSDGGLTIKNSDIKELSTDFRSSLKQEIARVQEFVYSK